MPRFFFHVVNDISSQLDEEGSDLPDLAAACTEARKIVGEILADEVRGTSKLIHLTVLIDDADGFRVGNIQTVTRVVSETSPFA